MVRSSFLGGLFGRPEPVPARATGSENMMDEFGQGDLPNRLFDNCTLYYFLYDPQGWEAVAYLAPIMALWEMCHDYDPDHYPV